MGKVLVIVDVQLEFNRFIQHNLVDELYDYAKQFKRVYQIWDTHKTDIAPTYKFPNEVKSVRKLYGKNHFSDKVKEFVKEVENQTVEGNTFKLKNNNGYIVRIDNNHKWFYVNPEMIELIEEIKNDKIILVGGADNECLEDVLQAFKSFGLDVHLNKKYVYSAKTDNDDYISESTSNAKYRFKTKEEFEKEFKKYWRTEVTGHFTIEMDYLLGVDYPYDIPESSKSNGQYIKGFDGWAMSFGMLTKNLPKVPSYKPRKIIKESINSYSHRFKTKEEFEKDFGEFWRTAVAGHFDVGMDYLLGTDYPHDIPESSEHNRKYIKGVDRWIISFDMLTKNLSKVPSYKPRKIIKESINSYSHRFKTRKEFEKEFGDNWEYDISYGWLSPDMDYLLGSNYPYNISKTNTLNLKQIDDWSISFDMLTKNIPSYKPRKIVKESVSESEYRFKTKEEFEKEFKKYWRTEVTGHFTIEMDYLLGVDYPYDIPESSKSNGQYIKGFDGWTISFDMLTKNLPKIPSYKPRKIDRFIDFSDKK